MRGRPCRTQGPRQQQRQQSRRQPARRPPPTARPPAEAFAAGRRALNTQPQEKARSPLNQPECHPLMQRQKSGSKTCLHVRTLILGSTCVQQGAWNTPGTVKQRPLVTLPMSGLVVSL
jgi:hypothetical protein